MSKTIPVHVIASLAALAATGVPAAAVAQMADAQPPAQEQPSKKDAVAEWPAEKQAAYASWPEETQAYYWTLSPKRQKLFWGLTDPDKVALSGMSAADQAKAWEQIEGKSMPSEGRR